MYIQYSRFRHDLVNIRLKHLCSKVMVGVRVDGGITTYLQKQNKKHGTQTYNKIQVVYLNAYTRNNNKRKVTLAAPSLPLRLKSHSPAYNYNS